MNRNQVLFDQYVNALSQAKDATAIWWQRLLDAESARGATPQQGEQSVRKRWPMGPTAHPLVLATYRKFFIACEQLNEILSAEYAQKMQKAEAQDKGEWGAEDSDVAEATESPDDWGEEREIDPPTFLVDMLFGRRDDLGEFLGLLVFSPVGEEDDRSV